MSGLSISLITYLLTIIISLVIAIIVHFMVILLHKFHQDIPSSQNTSKNDLSKIAAVLSIVKSKQK